MTNKEKLLWIKSKEFIQLRKEMLELIKDYEDTDHPREHALICFNATLEIAVNTALALYKKNKSEALNLISKTVNLMIQNK